MSIATAIQNARSKIAAAYEACERKGSTATEEPKDLAHLSSYIDAIPAGRGSGKISSYIDESGYDFVIAWNNELRPNATGTDQYGNIYHSWNDVLDMHMLCCNSTATKSYPSRFLLKRWKMRSDELNDGILLVPTSYSSLANINVDIVDSQIDLTAGIAGLNKIDSNSNCKISFYNCEFPEYAVYGVSWSGTGDQNGRVDLEYSGCTLSNDHIGTVGSGSSGFGSVIMTSNTTKHVRFGTSSGSQYPYIADHTFKYVQGEEQTSASKDTELIYAYNFKNNDIEIGKSSYVYKVGLSGDVGFQRNDKFVDATSISKSSSPKDTGLNYIQFALSTDTEPTRFIGHLDSRDKRYFAYTVINGSSLTYDANGGHGEVPTDDDTMILTKSHFIVKDGSSLSSADDAAFYMWNTAPDGTGETFFKGTDCTYDRWNMTLYAQYYISKIKVSAERNDNIVTISVQPYDYAVACAIDLQYGSTTIPNVVSYVSPAGGTFNVNIQSYSIPTDAELVVKVKSKYDTYEWLKSNGSLAGSGQCIHVPDVVLDKSKRTKITMIAQQVSKTSSTQIDWCFGTGGRDFFGIKWPVDGVQPNHYFYFGSTGDGDDTTVDAFASVLTSVVEFGGGQDATVTIGDSVRTANTQPSAADGATLSVFNSGSSGQYPSNMKLLRLKVEIDNALVADLIPIYGTKSQHQPYCLLNLVNGTQYDNGSMLAFDSDHGQKTASVGQVFGSAPVSIAEYKFFTYAKSSEGWKCEGTTATDGPVVSTDFNLDATDTVIADFQYLELSPANYGCVWCARTGSSDTSARSLFYTSNNSKLRYQCGSRFQDDLAAQKDVRCTVTAGKSGERDYFSNGSYSITYLPNPQFTGSTAGNVVLFAAVNAEDAYAHYANTKLYSFIVKNAAGETIHNLIPARSNIAMKDGLYDTVTNKFYASLNQNAIICGDDIEIDKPTALANLTYTGNEITGVN